jgi:hypothetical protein
MHLEPEKHGDHSRRTATSTNQSSVKIRTGASDMQSNEKGRSSAAALRVRVIAGVSPAMT